MLRNVRILVCRPKVSYFGILLENPILLESNVTIGLFAGLEVMATNLLSIFYTDYQHQDS